MNYQSICEVYRNQTDVFSSNTNKAIKQAFKNKKLIVAFMKDGLHLFNSLKDFTEAFKDKPQAPNCGKLKITEEDLQEFSDAMDFVQMVSKQIKCKIFIMNF